MKALAECRVKLHLQVHDARRVSARCCAVYHVIDPTSTTVVFNGGLFTAKQLAAKLCFGMRAISDIEDCGKFRSTLSKVLLLSREVRNNVWVWCDDVLPCWEEFCSKVQQDLQDRTLDLLQLENVTWASRPEDLSVPTQSLLQFQEDAIDDANLRLEQWKGTVDPKPLMEGIWGEVQELANGPGHKSGAFAVSMTIFLYLAPPKVRQYVSCNLWRYGPSSLQAGEQASGDLDDSSGDFDSSCASHDEDELSHGGGEVGTSDAETGRLDEGDVQAKELADRHDMAASVRVALGLSV
ncbi:TPA: hypothetical protein ACH3X2_009818 [Trebouxia sp. C0005]